MVRCCGLHRVLGGVSAAACALLLSAPVLAGTTGKLAGRVLDENGAPVVAATVRVEETRLGAYADTQGEFTILNVPPGTYSVSVGRIGFRTTTLTDVAVSVDKTTRLDVVLKDAAVETEEVIVVAERPPVDVTQTSTRTTLSADEIEELPVQELQEVVNLQAGVVDGHFRGGRKEEVQYQVDGVSVNNAFNNSSTLRVDRSLIQEVQVISGTFDAEYGQAMSGVVNAVLKDGGDRFEWSGEVFGGAFFFPDHEEERLTGNHGGPTSIQNYQASVSGPLPLPETVFLANLRRYVFDDWFYGERRFRPTDEGDFAGKVFEGTGDDEVVPLGFTREWSGVVKVTNRSFPNAKIGYQALFNDLDTRRSAFAFRFNPDGLSEQETFAITHGVDWSHTLTASSFLNVSLRQNFFRYEDSVYDDLYDARYDSAGRARGERDYELGAVVQGVEFTRFLQRTNTLLFDGAFVSQVNAHHEVKTGLELQFPRVKFGNSGHLVFVQEQGEDGEVVERLVRFENRPPDFPGPSEYHPVFGAAYVQDNMEWEDLNLRAGLRLEYFDARSAIPGDLANPANAISGAPTAAPVETDVKITLAPRLGVAHPITDRAAVHFAYGHFYQFPAIGTIFNNADYGILAELQASSTSYGVMGNPDVKPEQTVQYEIGYKHALSEDLGIDVTAFYKDIRDLLGVEFISTYNDAEYARLTNVDFGNVLGFTVAVDHRRIGPLGVSLDYTWQRAQGNSSDPRETATRASAGEDPRPRLIPLDWDQRHTFNMTVTLSRPDDYIVSGVVRVGSGQPYTPIVRTLFEAGRDANAGRKPSGMIVDLRAEKRLGSGDPGLGVFARVFNLFDARYFNGGVFASTGSPYYSINPGDDVALEDPTRFYPPRRIEVGLTLRSGS